MTVPLYALLAFVVWTLLILVGVAFVRVHKVLSGRTPPNGFPSGQPHGSDRYWRTNRAHMNCVENLPLFASVVLVGAVLHVGSPALDSLAVAYIVARIGQTVAHISSGRNIAVNIRFGFFLAQVGCLLAMVALTVNLAV